MRTFSFILALILIIALGLFFNHKGLIFSSKTDSGLDIQFSPDELISSLKKYEANDFAGICNLKHFVRFASDDNRYFTYYFLASSSDRNGNELYFNEHASEKIEANDFTTSILYTLRKQKDYIALITYLEAHKVAPPTELSSLPDFQHDDTSYVLNDVVFFDRGYQINENGYTIYIVPVKDYISLRESILKKDSANIEKPSQKRQEKRIDSSVGYIFVNEANACSRPDIYYLFTTLKKGTKLTIIKRTNDFYYCDFVDINDAAKTGWISSSDVSFKKPKKNPTSEQEPDTLNH